MTAPTTVSNTALIRRWFEEVWHQRRPEVIDEFVTEHSVCHAEQGPLTGPEHFKQQVYYPMTAAFPNLDVNVDEVLEAGDNVVVRWSVKATHSGDALGFAPTNRNVSFTGITWVRFKDGKFKEGWQSSNIPIVLQELAHTAG
jgi:predicted ester cyclase